MVSYPSPRRARHGCRTVTRNLSSMLMTGLLAVAACSGTGPVVGSGSAPLSVNSLVLETLGARNGVLVVFAPATCNLKFRDFVALNRLSHLPGMTVRGIAMVDAPDNVGVTHYTEPFGIEFPVALDSEGAWEDAIRATDMDSPLLAFVRDGRLQGLLWSDATLGLKGMPFAWEEFAQPLEGGS